MRNISRILSLILGLLVATAVSIPAQAAFPAKWNPGHYLDIYFLTPYPQSQFNFIKNEPNFVGVTRRYAWKWLEPQRGVYDFSMIEADLKYLSTMPTPKRLIIQIADNGNDPAIWIPDYTKTAEFQGGYYKTLWGHSVLITKRWNKGIQDRQIALFKALGARFDKEPYVEGVVLDETANGNLIWKGEAARANYTSEEAYIGQKRIMSGLKAAFPNTMCIQYINWWSGDSAQDVEAKLKGLFQHAFAIGMGVGGPDVHLSLKVPTYPWYAQYAGSMPLGPAVQWGNYTQLNPKTGRMTTVAELLDFATRTLHADHIFWEQREPYLTRDLIPLVREAGALTGAALPPATAPVPTSATPASTPVLTSAVPTTATSTFTNTPASSPASGSLSNLLVRPNAKAAANPVGSKGVRKLKRNKGMTFSQSARRLKLKRSQASSSKATSLNEMLARINVVK